ncbi:MAG: hypothetical protein WDZ27_05935 [Waddliaceae bacterium]
MIVLTALTIAAALSNPITAIALAILTVATFVIAYYTNQRAANMNVQVNMQPGANNEGEQVEGEYVINIDEGMLKPGEPANGQIPLDSISLNDDQPGLAVENNGEIDREPGSPANGQIPLDPMRLDDDQPGLVVENNGEIDPEPGSPASNNEQSAAASRGDLRDNIEQLVFQDYQRESGFSPLR